MATPVTDLRSAIAQRWRFRGAGRCDLRRIRVSQQSDQRPEQPDPDRHPRATHPARAASSGGGRDPCPVRCCLERSGRMTGLASAVSRVMKHVAVGRVTIGNDLPFVLIAGPCQIESREHALETAPALVEMSRARGLGLIYKSSFDKANRTSADEPARARARQGHRGAGRGARALRLPGADRRPREPPVQAGRRGGRRAADPGLPLPPDRPARRGGQDRRRAARQEGPVPGALGHAAGRAQARAAGRRRA